MLTYIIRRIIYTLPIWIGVYGITFALFHMRDPIAIARVHMPQAPDAALKAWVRNNNLHLPRFVNLPADADTVLVDGKKHPELASKSIFYSQFFLGIREIITFDFGVDKNRQPIGESIAERAPYSLSVMLPAFLVTVTLSVVMSLFLAYFRETGLDVGAVLITVAMMSIPVPVYLLLCNWGFGKYLKLVPVYNHVLLPILVSVLAGLGGQVRFYRTVFLEQIEQDYIRTARAKGVSESGILFKHVLPNSLIPILTSVVMSLPFLITGSLILEHFFGIPGMGDMMYTAIYSQDFQVIKVMVYLGAFLYMIGALLTDISYILADPRVVLE